MTIINAASNNSMDVRAKQRLCLLACLLSLTLYAAVSPHVISAVRLLRITRELLQNVNMNIRFVNEKDADVLARLNRKFNKTQDTEQQVATRIKANPLAEIAFVAELEGTIVGFACLRVTRSICYDFALAELTELYVDELFRRRGIGRALIEQAERIAQEQDAESLMLLTGGKNLTAQEFYRSSGYQVLQDLVLSKKLADS